MASTGQTPSGSARKCTRAAPARLGRATGAQSRAAKASLSEYTRLMEPGAHPTPDGTYTSDWAGVMEGWTLHDFAQGLPLPHDAGARDWEHDSSLQPLYPEVAEVIPLVNPSPTSSLHRRLPLFGAIIPPGTRESERTAHGLRLRRTVVPSSLINPTYVGKHPYADGDGWFRPGVDDDPSGFKPMKLNGVYLNYNPEFSAPSDNLDVEETYDLLHKPDLVCDDDDDASPAPRPPPPPSSFRISNLNSITAICGLDSTGIAKFLDSGALDDFDKIKELVIGDADKEIVPFLELNPTNNSKGTSAFNLGGTWIIFGSGIGSVAPNIAGDSELAERVRQINALALPIAIRTLQAILTKRELELLNAESDLRNSATMEGLAQKYFTSAQLNISFPDQDISATLGVFGRLHVDIKDLKTGLTVVIDASHLRDDQYPGGGAHIPSGLFMNVKGHSVFAFRGTEPHIPLNPKSPHPPSSPEGGKMPTQDSKGRSFCRITIVCYINENLFARHDKDGHPYPLAVDIGQVIGMKGTAERVYKTFRRDGAGFWGIPVGEALERYKSLEVRPGLDPSLAQRQLAARMARLQQSQLAAALFLEREWAHVDYHRHHLATGASKTVSSNAVATYSKESMETRLRSRYFIDAYNNECCLSDALDSSTVYLDTPLGRTMLARIARQVALASTFIHELPKGKRKEEEKKDGMEDSTVFETAGLGARAILDEIEAARALVAEQENNCSDHGDEEEEADEMSVEALEEVENLDIGPEGEVEQGEGDEEEAGEMLLDVGELEGLSVGRDEEDLGDGEAEVEVRGEPEEESAGSIEGEKDEGEEEEEFSGAEGLDKQPLFRPSSVEPTQEDEVILVPGPATTPPCCTPPIVTPAATPPAEQPRPATPPAATPPAAPPRAATQEPEENKADEEGNEEDEEEEEEVVTKKRGNKRARIASDSPPPSPPPVPTPQPPSDQPVAAPRRSGRGKAPAEEEKEALVATKPYDAAVELLKFTDCLGGVPTAAVLVEEFSYLRTVLDWLLERVKLSPEAYRSLPSNRSLMAVSEMVLQKSMAPSLSSSVSDLLQLPTLASLATRQHTIESDYRLLLEMHSRMQVAASHLSNARLALVTFPQLARTAFMTLFGSDSTTATSLRNSSAPYDKLCTTIYDNLLPFRSKQGRFSVNITLSPALISELVTLPSASLPKELRPLQKSSVIPSATFNISATITDDKFERTFVEIVTNVLEEVLLVPACRTLEKYSDRLEMGVRNKEEEDTLFDVDDTTLAERRDTKRRIRLRHNLISSLVGEDGADANLAIFALPLVFNFINRPGSFFHVSCRLSNDPRLVSRGMKKRSTVVQHVEERRIVNHLALIRINPLFLEASVKIKEGLSALRRALELQALGKGTRVRTATGSSNKIVVDTWIVQKKACFQLAAAFVSECLRYQFGWPPENDKMYKIIASDPDKFMALPFLTPSIEWIRRRLPKVTSFHSPSQRALLHIVRESSWGRTVPTTRPPPALQVPFKRHLDHPFLDTLTTPVVPTTWKKEVSDSNRIQLDGKLEDRRDQMGSRNMYGAATMVTPKAVASAMSYGHQWANAIEGKMATWAEARSAKRFVRNRSRRRSLSLVHVADLYVLHSSAVKELPNGGKDSLIGHLTASTAAFVFPNDIAPATITELSHIIKRGARAGLQLFDHTIGPLNDKSSSSDDNAVLAWQAIATRWIKGGPEILKPFKLFTPAAMENTPCKMTRVGKEGGFEKVKPPTDDNCIFSSEFLTSWRAWSERGKDLMDDEAELERLANLPPTAFAQRCAVALKEYEENFYDRTEEQEKEIGRKFAEADKDPSWEEVRRASMPVTLGGKGLGQYEWWGDGLEEVASFTALQNREKKAKMGSKVKIKTSSSTTTPSASASTSKSKSRSKPSTANPSTSRKRPRASTSSSSSARPPPSRQRKSTRSASKKQKKRSRYTIESDSDDYAVDSDDDADWEGEKLQGKRRRVEVVLEDVELESEEEDDEDEKYESDEDVEVVSDTEYPGDLMG